ncbi:ABC transporter ATP-binding protein [Pseudooceanicola sp. CBS1P-1]|uniref:ATP-binding cassette domain-containing protein n=1 Tax=Pseudooceanicola albus TaxID=2692189 RepID=A0A6L7GA02_9RHOB|nr:MULTISPECIES: ABC transporter ATP-binding protein [Pseudooceanicola]MBT9386309.1 ABC transporter ATP-binding protein [Pseudooceanicola endophyticus]MXN20358.1 ATP-binding cassette domain-containing protein [Pseudooceanicola albus]
MTFLTIDGLEKSYGKVRALERISLGVAEGEFVTLLGPSGSGKTTLLMSVAGFTEPTAGRILLGDQDITRLDPEDRDFGFVFQGYALFPHLSVADNIAFPLRVRKWPRARIQARVEEMLALVGLEAMARRKPAQLSGGQQQRVALARALSFGPRMMLLDEPLSALDRSLRDSMQQELKRLHRETGVTFLYVTHDQEEAYAMSDRIAVFHRGRLVQSGPPREIYARPANSFVAGFIGGNNLFTARHDPHSGEIDLLGRRLRLGHLDPGLHCADGKVTGWIRPEALRPGPAAPGELELALTLEDISFAGTGDRLFLRSPDGQPLIASQTSGPTGPAFRPGPITCAVHPDDIGFLPARQT